MKTLLTKVFLTFGLVCAGTCGLQAQNYRMVAKVPFNFTVSNTEVTAGTYLFDRSDTLDAQFLTNMQTGRKLCIMAGGSQWTRQGKPRLTFHRYGDIFFLAEIWPASSNGSKLKPSKAETALRESLASAHPADVTVYLAGAR